ncbi:MAG: hypothetical protein H7A53_05595 [Akkermansiaceae bacterium]|nr:hypothetical protein [Akkermansiaceae bacterium]
MTHEAAGTHFAVRVDPIASDGFEIVLTEPVDRVPALVADRYRVGQFAFPDGDPTRATAVAPERVTIEPDGKTLALRLPDLDAGRVYAFDLGELRSETGAPLAHGPVYYSVRSLAPSVAEPAPPGGEKADTGEASDPKADPVETREAR